MPYLPGESARASLKPVADVGLGALLERYLPGESARASLKLRIEGWGVVLLAGSPGRIGPGLIEAIRVWTCDMAVSNYLPGESARASLKRMDLGPASPSVTHISRANRPGPH